MGIVYISGPMTGLPGLNKKAFRAAARKLAALGYQIVSPLWSRPNEKTWAGYMQADLEMLERATAIFMLDGWKASAGARIERRYAKKLGLKCLN